MLAGLMRFMRWWWMHLSLLLDHAKPVRVPLLVLLIAVVVTLGVDQASELFLIAVWIDPDNWRFLALVLGSALAGLASWYAARHAYRLIYPRWPALQDPRGEWLRDWVPRVLGALVPFLVLLGYLVASWRVPHASCAATGDCFHRDVRASLLLAESVLLALFFVFRRRLFARLALGKPLPAKPHQEPRVPSVRDLGRTPLRVAMLAIGCNVAVLCLIVFRPEVLDGLGPLAILLFSAAFLCASGSFLCMIADRRGWPLLTSLLLLSAALHAMHLNDNHRVRQYPSMSTHQRPQIPPPDLRARFDDYANAWLTDRCKGRATCPVVLASSEGGGISGAAWTTTVLGQLGAAVDAARPSGVPAGLLHRYLFAGSGVSGGSLGLASYVALARHVPTDAVASEGERLLSHDFLAPELANMLFVDATQRWLPGAWFNDRSRALTRAWERAAHEQGIDEFAQSFAAMYVDDHGEPDTRTPALFLNSTTVQEGRRFIQHPFRPIATPQSQPWNDAFDGSAWLDPRVPLSEVVLNSARFTYVSPAGTLESAAVNAPLPSRLQLVDGGYFENSGTSTLSEVMRRVQAIAAARQINLRIIVLHVSNDPDLGDFVAQHDPSQLQPWYSAVCPAAAPIVKDDERGEVTAPLSALMATRSARGEYARTQLLDALHPSRGDMLWHFRICRGDYPIPLGWTISTPVFDEMARQLRQNYPVQAMGKVLADTLAGPQGTESHRPAP